ncbi:flavin-dependent oxidoreductase [Beijerinckia sp. L45]|uniref:flavin-dependent oxidoreductase n=1 Tax=Beijerinckia sp. L45 TaxID=1641855 RepID=UPI00131CD37A|nr:flavin-dependent oxidoreductase [Beijerinckia sp. L45]
MRILIAGGGVGGLTLALMLQARGIETTVFEAAAAVKPLGVGINALPHAIAQLDELDLLPQLHAIGIATRTLTYANHRGQTIWSEPRGLHAGHKVPQFSIHRGRLQQMLWDEAVERLGAEAIRPDRRLVGYRRTKTGIIARFTGTDGTITEEKGDALIGADGIHSWLRASLHPDDPGIRWNGIKMWRGATDWPAFDGGDAMVIAGDGVAKLVLYPIGAGATPETRLTNWVIYARVAEPNAPMPERESWSRKGRYEDFSNLVDRLHLPFVETERLIRSTAEIFEYPMCDRDPLPWWTQGRVTLLGDAAHAMYPVGSNGASQAILDARCLADHLATLSVTKALAAYEAERRPATAAIVASNRVGGPERVIDLVASRAPTGFQKLDDVATPEELRGIAQGYAQLAGFAVAAKA